jgi:hypothetical protein
MGDGSGATKAAAPPRLRRHQGCGATKAAAPPRQRRHQGCGATKAAASRTAINHSLEEAFDATQPTSAMDSAAQTTVKKSQEG